jgi:transcriptional regulator with XRE-family HTH domain
VSRITGIGDAIRRERAGRGWTQEKLAEIARIAPRTLQSVETEDRISLATMKAISDALEMTIEELRGKADLSRETPATQDEILPRVSTGRQLTSIMGGAEMFYQDHDDLKDAQEVDLLAGFLQELEDIGDLWPEFGAGNRVEMAHHLGARLAEVEAAGFRVFGKRAHRRIVVGGDNQPGVMNMTVAHIVILRNSNAKIVEAESGEFVAAVS